MLIAVSFVCFGCGSNMVPINAVPAPSEKPTQTTPIPTPVIPKNGNYPGKGKVTKINNTLGSVEVDHDEIVGVMPAMIMEFYVKDNAILNGLEVGDSVDFVLEYKHPAETIVSITKIK